MGIAAQIGMLIVQTMYFLLPAYFANMAPILGKNVLKSFASPIDGGKKWKGNPLFGSHKTWRGVLLATIAGGAVFWIQQYAYVFSFVQKISLLNYSSVPIMLGFLLGFGAIMGDLGKSFIKRRIGRKSGEQWFPFDQIDYMIGAFLFGSVVFFPGWKIVLIGIILATVLNSGVNYLSYKMGLKEVQW